jgi:antibiotic biosynthesis monooxygenase (ABM) superfamily enzyme
MIARVWHGRTTRENAAAYEDLLGTTILPGIDRVQGYRGADLFRRDLGDEIEFMTVTRFDSLDAVREFAGDDYGRAVISDEAHRLLSQFDERVAIYELAFEDE